LDGSCGSELIAHLNKEGGADSKRIMTGMKVLFPKNR